MPNWVTILYLRNNTNDCWKLWTTATSARYGRSGWTRRSRIGSPPPQFSDDSIGTIATNQTCNLTPSIIEGEEEDEKVATTPQATEGPYFVDEMLNRSDIRVDPTDGSIQQGIPLTVVLYVYDVNEGTCIPIGGALVDIWHANASGAYSDVEQTGTAGTKFKRVSGY